MMGLFYSPLLTAFLKGGKDMPGGMTKERKGEIAYVLLKAYVANRPDGLSLNPERFRENLKEASAATSVSVEELKEFTKSVLQELCDEVFN